MCVVVGNFHLSHGKSDQSTSAWSILGHAKRLRGDAVCRASYSSCFKNSATNLSVSSSNLASVKAGKDRYCGSDGRVTRGREEGKAGSGDSGPSDLMGAPVPVSFSRRVISGQHIPGVAHPGTIESA
eukprot:sb/3475455/